MRSLFLRMFFWFWATVLVLGLTFVGMLLMTSFRSFRNHRAAFQRPLVLYAQAASIAWQESGAQALRDLQKKSSDREPSYFFDGQSKELDSGHAPAAVYDLMAQALVVTGADSCLGSEGWIACKTIDKDGKPFFAVVHYRYPFQGLIFSVKEWVMLVPPLVIVAGIVCFGMARYLTRPISRLRWLTRRFADGDLGARIDNLSAFQHSEEMRGLAGDFNRMAQRIQHLLEQQQQLLWDIAHELRTPLTRIALAIGLARQHTPGQAPREFERIDREIERVHTLLGQISAIARLESSAAPVDSEELNLSKLVHDIATDSTLESNQRNVTIEVKCEDLLTVHGSRELIRAAIENVLRNALRHTCACLCSA